MAKQFKYVKIYTVQINRITVDTPLWYYNHKDEFYNCVLIVKQGYGSITLKPMFLVVEKRNDEFICPGIVRTIRPTDCSVIAEHVIESKSLYDTILVFGNKNGKEILYPEVNSNPLKQAV
jgi:hypothetical protein